MKLTRSLKVKRNELIAELHRTRPELGYGWAVEEGCRIVREAIAETESSDTAPEELTAAAFHNMPAEQLAALILRR